MAHRNVIIVSGCLLSLFALVGCGRQNVSADPKYQAGFVPGATYRLLVDAQYFTDSGGFIITEGTYNGGHGALVPKGVRIQMDRIEREWNLDTHYLVYYMGHFVDGPFAGSKIELNGITMYTTTYEKHWDPEVLEPVP